MKIMLVDDEQSVNILLKKIIEDAGFQYRYVPSGEEALAQVFLEEPDLILLDVMLPGRDGFSICREMRERGILSPILFLTAKGDIVDKSIGFDAGGDDYLVKPFIPQELILRIKSHLRQYSRMSTQGSGQRLVVEGIEFDNRRHVVVVKGKSVELSPKEFHILHLLASHAGEVYSRDQLLKEIWGDEYLGDVSKVAVYMRKIREKIEDDPARPIYIQTVWRNGYRFGN